MYHSFKRIVVVCIGLACMISASATSIAGKWSGVLKVTHQVQLKLVFNVKYEPGQPGIVTMDSPDQGVYGIPCQVNYISADSLDVAVSRLMMRFAASLTRESTVLQGSFSQGSLTLPLSLSKDLSHAQRPQTPHPPFPYEQREVTFTNPSGNAVLAGTLTLPHGYTSDTPVLLMVSGSGQQNRDEEMFGHKPFAVVADMLARKGIATLRYDDRGYGKSTGDLRNATTRDFADDATAGIDYLREAEEFNHVGVYGHSEGASIAFMTGAAGKSDFIVAVGAPALRGDTILADQSARILRLSGVPDATVQNYYDSLLKLYSIIIDSGAERVKPYLADICAPLTSDPVGDALAQNLHKIPENINPWLKFL